MATTSPKFSLQALDFLKSLAVAALSQPILVILTSLAAGSFNINWTEQWHLAVASAAAYLIKNFFSGVTPPTSGTSSGATKALITVLMVGSLFTTASAQSPFKPLTKVTPKVANQFARATAVTATDSIITAGRFIANIAAYSEPGNILMAGVGYGIQKLDYNYSSQKWYCKWSVSGVAFAGGSVAPSTPASVMSIGILGGVLNNELMAGPVYNFGTKQFGVAVSVGINLNN